MKKLTIIAVFAFVCFHAQATNFTLPEFSARTKVMDNKVLNLKLINLQKKRTKIELSNLAGTTIFYFNSVNEHNGYNSNFNLSDLGDGKYILTIRSNGKTQKQVIRIKNGMIFISEFV